VRIQEVRGFTGRFLVKFDLDVFADALVSFGRGIARHITQLRIALASSE
jgi:hypothetical protein